MPSANSVLGEAVTVEVAALTAGFAIKVTVAVWLTVMVSVASVAVKTGAPTVEDFTVKVTTPAAVDWPVAAEIVSIAARLEASVTVFPATGFCLLYTSDAADE